MLTDVLPTHSLDGYDAPLGRPGVGVTAGTPLMAGVTVPGKGKNLAPAARQIQRAPEQQNSARRNTSPAVDRYNHYTSQHLILWLSEV